MTQKTAKPVIALLLTIVLMLTGAFICCADSLYDQETESQEKFVYIKNTSCSCVISGATASCKASLICNSSCSMSIKMELQKLQSGSYSTVKTWTSSKTGTSLSVTKTKLINVLSTYRLKVTFTAGSETVTAYAYP